MKYTKEQTEKRTIRREQRKKMKTIRRHFALFPATCYKCKREFQFERGYRISNDYGIVIYVSDMCNECAHSKEEAYKKYYQEYDGK